MLCCLQEGSKAEYFAVNDGFYGVIHKCKKQSRLCNNDQQSGFCYIQSNLCTITKKKWSLLTGGRFSQVHVIWRLAHV